MPFPGKIGKNCTVAQLVEEAEARGMILGNIKPKKAFLLDALGEGSLSVIALAEKRKKSTTASTTLTTRKPAVKFQSQENCGRVANTKTKATVKPKAMVIQSKKVGQKTLMHGAYLAYESRTMAMGVVKVADYNRLTKASNRSHNYDRQHYDEKRYGYY